MTSPVGKPVLELPLVGGQPSLQLGEDESVRVLAASPRLILLERCGTGSAPLPWDRELVLSAEVRAFPLADVLNLLHTSSKSGFLFLENGDHAKSVYLHRGEVVFAASNQTVDRLGETLLRVGVITAEQFSAARRAYSPASRFGRVLVERGYLSPRELWNGVKVQVEEIVRSLFSYSAGRIYFWEGEIRPDNVVRLSLPTRRLIAEGLRRRDELLRFLAWLEDPRVELVRQDAGPGEFVGAERAMLEAIDGASSFRAVCHRAGVDPVSATRTLQLLTLVGAVATRRREEPAAGTGAEARPSDDESVRDCVRTHVKLMAELAAPIVAVEGPDALQERLGPVAEEAARRYPELLEGIAVGPGGTLDPDQLIDRALRFPGEREREVRLGLGELVSYLEFDLLNHPRIDDPEQFLEAVESLRAAI